MVKDHISGLDCSLFMLSNIFSSPLSVFYELIYDTMFFFMSDCCRKAGINSSSEVLSPSPCSPFGVSIGSGFTDHSDSGKNTLKYFFSFCVDSGSFMYVDGTSSMVVCWHTSRSSNGSDFISSLHSFF